MLKRDVTYTDFNGEEQTEVLYFNLSKSELTKLEMRESIIKGEKVTGGLRDRIQKVMDGGSGADIIDLVEMIIRESYGVRSEDGKSFTKSEERSKAFMSSAAYDVIFMDLVTDADKAAQFMNAILPADIAGQAQAEMDKKKAGVTPDPHPAELTPEERELMEREIIARRIKGGRLPSDTE